MKYHVIIHDVLDNIVLDEWVDSPADVQKTISSMLGVRIESWVALHIHVYKREN